MLKPEEMSENWKNTKQIETNNKTYPLVVRTSILGTTYYMIYNNKNEHAYTRRSPLSVKELVGLSNAKMKELEK